MRWQCPVPFRLTPTGDSESFLRFGAGITGMPVGPHKGAFGVRRRMHVHEGVDLYVPEHTPVTAVENSVVVGVQPFTGEHAGSPWWEDTWAVLAEGATGVVVYGEVIPGAESFIGSELMMGDLVGFVKRVLRVDKGRPTSMLHLELHAHGARECPEWPLRGPMPASLRDPSPYLMASVCRTP